MIAGMAYWSQSKVFKLLGLYAVIFLGLWVFISFLNLLMPFMLAALLAFFLAPFVDQVEGLGFPRTWSVIIVYAVIAGMIGLAIWLASPMIEHQVGKFQAELPTYIASVQQMWSGAVKDLKSAESRNGMLKMAKLSRLLEGGAANPLEKIGLILGVAITGLGGFAWSALGWLAYVGLVPFLAFFFLRDGPAIKKALIQMVPNRYFEMALSIHYEVDQQIRSFFKGQFLEGMCVGLLAWLGLWWIGLSYSFFVGLAAGLTNMIPYVGPVVGSVVGVAVALIDAQNPILALKVVGVLMGVQFVDSAILSTIIVGQSVDMHPVMVVLAVVVGGATMGVWGMLLGVPLLASTMVTMKILARGFEAYKV